MKIIKSIQVEILGDDNVVLATAVGKFSVEATNAAQPFITIKLLERLELDVIIAGTAKHTRLSVQDASVTVPVLNPYEKGIGLRLSSKQLHTEGPLYMDSITLTFPAFTQSHNPHKFTINLPNTQEV